MTQSHPLEQHAQRIAKQLAKTAKPHLGDTLRHALQEHPEWVMDSLKGLLEAESTTESGQNWLLDAYSILLGQQLELLRYGVDRGRAQEIDLAHQFQHRVVGLARHGHISTLLLGRIAVLLRDAKLQPIPELFEAASALLQAMQQPENFDMDAIPAFLQELAREAEGDPFDIARGLTELTYAMPPDALGMLAALILNEPDLGLAEAAPLMILDDRAEARLQLRQVLHAEAKQLSPISLRRLIALRNWLPEGERKPIDDTIKLARRQGVECAPWPEPKGVEIFASVVDGSGAQGFYFLSHQGRKHTVASILTRLGKGILDAWTLPDLSKREMEGIVSDINAEMPVHAISWEYLDLVIQHHLATGVDSGMLPPVALLKVAESSGAHAWRPQSLNVSEAILQLLSQLPEELRDPSAMADILQTSGDWALLSGITDSWFEDDQAVEDLLAKARASKRSTLVQKILKDILQPRAQLWAERCLWAALWCKEGPEDLRELWPNFAMVASVLNDGYPVKVVPLMTEIAERTLDGAGR